MRRMIVAGLALMAIGAGTVKALSVPTPQSVIDERVAGMKKMVANLTAIGTAAGPEDIKNQLSEAIAFSETISSRFPKGTGIGDPEVTKTRALQDIWIKTTEFKTAADALTAALQNAKAGADDPAKLDAALSDVKKACGGCHTPFRGPKTE